MASSLFSIFLTIFDSTLPSFYDLFKRKVLSRVNRLLYKGEALKVGWKPIMSKTYKTINL